MIFPEQLGSALFRKTYHTRYAYAAGAMYKGIASKELVVRMGKAQLLSFLGTGGLPMSVVEAAIQMIQSQLTAEQPYGCNLLHQPEFPELEMATVDLLMRYNVRHVEAAAFMQMTPSLIWYRLKGVHRDAAGRCIIPHAIIAKVSRPEIAQQFMRPAPIDIVKELVAAGKLTQEEAELSQQLPLATDICVESDSGGHTDRGVALVLVPAILELRDKMLQQYQYATSLRVGAAGGIGTPQAVAAAFILGVDFIITGSINQCTVEGGTSDSAKDILQTLSVQDTTYAPAGDMFELGAKIQVVKKGLLFAPRANRLYDLYRHHESLETIDAKTLEQVQQQYFHRNFDAVWEETKRYYAYHKPEILAKAESNPKQKMALIFRWYFVHTTRLAMRGEEQQKVDYQIHCGPALGAFNAWVSGTELESWRNRHVDQIAEKLMCAAADLLNLRCQQWQKSQSRY